MIGAVPGVAAGAWFANRAALRAAGIHRPTMAGICGTAALGAESIVLAGGYVDDEDTGATIWYTGAGGNDPRTKRQTAGQTAGQTLTGVNGALVTSWRLGLPVRVVRGSPRPSVLREHPRVVFEPPPSGYRYDGLYLVTDYKPGVGMDGYRVWRFLLEQLPDDGGAQPHRVAEPADLFGTTNDSAAAPDRRLALVNRVVRDPTVTRAVKQLHAFRCQVCGQLVETPDGPYAEAAHIRPLGRDHDGPDTLDNVLCLCPNHHVAFDRWAFAIADDGALVGLPGRLRAVPEHRVGAAHVRYHRGLYEAVRSEATGCRQAG